MNLAGARIVTNSKFGGSGAVQALREALAVYKDIGSGALQDFSSAEQEAAQSKVENSEEMVTLKLNLMKALSKQGEEMLREHRNDEARPDEIRAMLVDLPGYGYAKVPEAVKIEWQKHLSDYLRGRFSLRGLVLLMDVRHPLTEFDQMMLDYADQRGMPVHILLTKADKLKKGPASAALQKVRSRL